VAHQDKRRQSDGRRGVAPRRFRYYLPAHDGRQLAGDFAFQIFIGNNPELFFRGEWSQALNRLLDHGALAIERQQLLGPALTAEGPEAGAPAPGQYYRIEMNVQFGHEFTRMLKSLRPAKKICRRLLPS
jgi:hypothetical protein